MISVQWAMTGEKLMDLELDPMETLRLGGRRSRRVLFDVFLRPGLRAKLRGRLKEPMRLLHEESRS